MATYELYKTEDGSTRVSIGDNDWPLLNADGTLPASATGRVPGEEVSQRTRAQIQRGDWGQDVQAWDAAHVALGLTPRFSTQGIINALGDHNEVRLPWEKPEPERPYLRSYSDEQLRRM